MKAQWKMNSIDIVHRLPALARLKPKQYLPKTSASEIYIYIFSKNDVAIDVTVFHIEGLNLLKLRERGGEEVLEIVQFTTDIEYCKLQWKVVKLSLTYVLYRIFTQTHTCAHAMHRM